MQHEAVPINRPGLLDALCDPLGMIIWEAIRRRGWTSAAELAGITGMPMMNVRASLDRLAVPGLVASRPAGRGRKTLTYRVTMPEIRIDCTVLPPAEVDDILARWEEGKLHLFQRLTQRELGPRSEVQRRGFGMDWAYLADDEGRRMTALLRELFGILIAAKERHARQHPDGSPPADSDQTRPYALMFHLAPVTAPILPTASVLFSRQPPARASRLLDEGLKRAELSPRERQVAEALVSGMTRPDVARQLGISPYTVVSLTQRIYFKLKVRSRAELARVMTSRL